MQFSTRTTAPERMRAGCALVPVLAGKELTDGGKALDAAHGGRLMKMVRSGDLPAKAGSTLLVQLDGALPRALLVTLGDAREATEKSFAEAVRGALKAAGQLAADEAVSLLHEAPVAGRDTDWKLTHVAQEVGFSSSQRLATAFREVLGLTPTAFRANARGGVTAPVATRRKSPARH